MASVLPNSETIVEAWIAALSHLESERSIRSLAFTMTTPQSIRENDVAAIRVHDDFLREYDSSVSTVSNTIFPRRVYIKHGYPNFFEAYDHIQPSIKNGSWGSYFERLTDAKGTGDRPLEQIVEKMKKATAAKSTFRNMYEWSAPLYDPVSDRNRTRPQPCMSHLSFSIQPDIGLCLTAMYRSHYYVAKLLGNLVGLRDLQAFICREAGLEPGELTIFSTNACFDTGGWGVENAKAMLSDAKHAAGYTASAIAG